MEPSTVTVVPAGHEPITGSSRYSAIPPEGS